MPSPPRGCQDSEQLKTNRESAIWEWTLYKSGVAVTHEQADRFKADALVGKNHALGLLKSDGETCPFCGQPR
jgi:hypothetical protein